MRATVSFHETDIHFSLHSISALTHTKAKTKKGKQKSNMRKDKACKQNQENNKTT